MNRIRAWLLSMTVGIVVGAGTSVWLVDDPSLAIALALVYAVGTRLFVEYATTLPGGTGRLDWQRTRWQAGFVAFMPFAAILAASPALFPTFGLRVAVLLLVFGVGWTGLMFGIAIARDQAAAGELLGETGPAGSAEHGDAAGTEKL